MPPPLPRTPFFGPKEENTEYIPLTKGFYAKVDANDFGSLCQYSWSVSIAGDKIYVARRFQKKITLMHRWILSPHKDLHVDHINGDPLDNRRNNLRICSQQQNNCNTKISSRNTSGYKGIHWNDYHQKWLVRITVHKKMYHLGLFDNLKDASEAYEKASKELHGEFARIK